MDERTVNIRFDTKDILSDNFEVLMAIYIRTCSAPIFSDIETSEVSDYAKGMYVIYDLSGFRIWEELRSYNDRRYTLYDGQEMIYPGYYVKLINTAS